MQLVDVKKASELEVTSQCSQHDRREFCYFGFSHLSEVTLIYFCKETKVGMRVIAVLRLYLLKSLLSVCESLRKLLGMCLLAQGTAFEVACSIGHFTDNSRGEELIGLGFQNVYFKVRPVTTCLKNVQL